MLLVYTGNGKGKTSACVGQAVRALGRNLKVCFGQFMKSNVNAGEQKVLANLLGADFYIGGQGFYCDEPEKPVHRAAAQNVYEWALSKAPDANMLVLDEALYALGSELITEEELKNIIVTCRKHNTHLVLSGRGLPEWLKSEADMVTEMGLVKHHYDSGVKAQIGIEF
ncbi:cob(I)yrinic acid a,c-diamide adenosyltransferase [Desulfovibrio sp. OttesenSCG-928-F07]|nr:cob(I)yrinic acid a,c-diamide adenosyltransferase [Desulfovibrio sp. OttesenSCG-928-F07]